MVPSRGGPPSPTITAADRETFARAIRAVCPMDDAALALGLGLVRVQPLARRAHLLRAGDRAERVVLVVEGMLREYFAMVDGVERTKAFVREGELSGSLADLLSGAPSRAFIVAEEPCRLLAWPFAQLADLADRDPSWDRFARAATQSLLLVKAEREHELLGLDAAARYAAFARRYPGLEARVAARHVASYLGITPVHLSRLRRRRRAGPRPGG